MSKNDKGAALPENKTTETAKVVTATTAATETPKAETKKSIADLKSELESRLQELNHKKKLADNRQTFLATDEDLATFEKELKKQQKEGHFETQTAKVTFKGRTKDGYRDEEVFSVSNVALIYKFIEVLRKEIEVKVKEIETELIF